ncbi:Phosphorelay intermediate protein [Madurella fahalii]|uniref:Phosphorelay intermediate protein n=1 Tax=Madurella fahalii TaxID=1157608 RepID=A0ABQ0G5D6_9PEZI
MVNFGDHVDQTVFNQILEMDDDEQTRDFSMPLVDGFFEQAISTFHQMDQALDARNLKELSALGHFLKGSSATLGFNKIRDSCQLIQQYGTGCQLDGTHEANQEVCLKQITDAIAVAKADVAELQTLMSKFFKSQA